MPHVPTDTDVYEVFAQTGSGSPLNHVGSLLAPRRDAAWHLAKETYGRRDDLFRLWVVRRTDLIVSSADDRGLLAAKTRMPHRQPGFPTTRRRDRATAPDTAAPPQPASAESGDPRGAAGPDPSRLWPALAEDLFVLGNRLGERIVDYIDLEESLAVGSIGQEALAHAETILTLHGFDARAADAHLFERPQEQWRVSRVIGLLTDWPSTVAGGLVLAAAVSVLAEERAAGEPAFAAIRDEQLVHLEHWRRWARALAAWPETDQEFTQAYADVTHCAGDLFGADPHNPLTQTLHARLAARIGDSGVPGSRLPHQPVPRAAGRGGSVLADCLRRGRLVREHYAPEVFL
ncbi:Phenylacetic acid catabolic protein [Streptomyces sp. S.PB5]|uniref:Phenylacetic acid catabolic protein n=1 Tax=Streptomyces sp. S.PB5 TaxID=3020844 RepID=UPI0025B11827|nr:Phenylacetic acid catabolic protein [Streptomyces sp. S.PB5]MDN3029382.1 phenylacetate-CoA oxygenase subunit PaaI [Streptomyces sp. S.PB5]